MSGALMEFSPLLATGDSFILPDAFQTASVCPVAGTSASYTITNVLGTSPNISDVTSFPDKSSKPWAVHTITCTAGNVIVKFQNQSIGR